MVGGAVGACVRNGPARDGGYAFVAGLPCAVAEFADVRDGHVVHGIRTESVEHDDQGFRFRLCVSHVAAEGKEDNGADGQAEDGGKGFRFLVHGWFLLYMVIKTDIKGK